MSLPKLEVPTYELKLPSTGETVIYRPFLVREHKVILTLMEADLHEIARGVTDLVDVCTFKKLDVNKLSHFDIEYIFLQLRGKSLGETVDMFVNCPCGEKSPHTVSLNDIVIEKSDSFTNKIQLTENIGIVMRYPKFEEIVAIYDSKFDVEEMLKVVKNCIETVYDSDGVYTRGSFNEAELDEFLNSLSKTQFEKIEEYFVKMPKVVQPIEKDCPACGRHNSLRLEGLQNFFV